MDDRMSEPIAKQEDQNTNDELCRIRVTGRKSDKELIQWAARTLADRGDNADQLRAWVAENIPQRSRKRK